MNKTQMRYWFLLAIVGLVILVGLRFAYNYAPGFTIANVTIPEGENLLCHVMEYANGTEYPHCHVIHDATMDMGMNMTGMEMIK
jgi:hypothetical protein